MRALSALSLTLCLALLPLEIDPVVTGVSGGETILADSLRQEAFWEDETPVFQFTEPTSVEALGEGRFRLSTRRGRRGARPCARRVQ